MLSRRAGRRRAVERDLEIERCQSYNASLPTPQPGRWSCPKSGSRNGRCWSGAGGCNWQVNGPWVVGIEAAWNAKAMNVSRDNNFPEFTGFPHIVTTEISWIASLTGRVGYAVTPDWLYYVKGSVAFAKIETAGNVTPSGAFDFEMWNNSKWHAGWTVGGGVEYRLFRNVTIGGEYNYYRFGDKDHLGALSAPVTPANFVNTT